MVSSPLGLENRDFARRATNGDHRPAVRGIARIRLLVLRNPARHFGSVLFGLANMVLSVEFETKARDELKLSFEEIDVLFLVAHQLFE